MVSFWCGRPCRIENFFPFISLHLLFSHITLSNFHEFKMNYIYLVASTLVEYMHCTCFSALVMLGHWEIQHFLFYYCNFYCGNFCTNDLKKKPLKYGHSNPFWFPQWRRRRRKRWFRKIWAKCIVLEIIVHSRINYCYCSFRMEQKIHSLFVMTNETEKPFNCQSDFFLHRTWELDTDKNE